jgi:hypothetical protein
LFAFFSKYADGQNRSDMLEALRVKLHGLWKKNHSKKGKNKGEDGENGGDDEAQSESAEKGVPQVFYPECYLSFIRFGPIARSDGGNESFMQQITGPTGIAVYFTTSPEAVVPSSASRAKNTGTTTAAGQSTTSRQADKGTSSRTTPGRQSSSSSSSSSLQPTTQLGTTAVAMSSLAQSAALLNDLDDEDDTNGSNGAAAGAKRRFRESTALAVAESAKATAEAVALHSALFLNLAENPQEEQMWRKRLRTLANQACTNR